MSESVHTLPPQRAPSSLAGSIQRQLKADIVACRLLPGTLMAAAQLAERFEVSRTPVHEALKALCQEGLLKVLPRVGYIVTPVTVRDIDEIFDLRLSLEVLGAGRAADLVTGQDVANLRAQHARAQENLGSGSMDDPAYLRSLMAGNREFHTKIAALSGNQRLARIVGRLLDEGERIYFLYFRSGRPAPRDDPHADIVQALAAGDPHAARAAMAAHIQDQQEGVRAGSGLP
jgi:DNA-binding GntR family transcriptional regulator